MFDFYFDAKIKYKLILPTSNGVVLLGQGCN